MKNLFLSFILLLFIGSCGPSETENQVKDTQTVDCDSITAENADQCLRLNHIQVLGTHNSYKIKPADALISALDEFNEGWARGLEYSHKPLTEQLEELGIRKFELDIFADTSGGRFAEPAGAKLINDEEYLDDEDMMKPGFKVIHVQDIDYRGTCRTLVNCLTEIRDWSSENPNHLPIMIMLEVKDGTPQARGNLSFTEALHIDESVIYDIDEEIWSVFSEDHVITPDDVREDFDTLEKAILEKGWPILAQSRGKILFALDNTNRIRDLYLSESSTLENRALFVSSRPGQPSAAFIKMNEVFDEEEEIKEFSEKGYLIRTRSDIPTVEARSGDTSRRDLALQSGAHYISTDYPEPSPFNANYIVTLPGAESPGRCNPVSAPESCKNSYIKE
ncbi:phosphatidylinositol-specific phospholipase C1-like protein [Rhodohalobacter sp. 614A]|uniref:phosphatidylinositol-specific phospholipase C1-like protein n=1 Tax=Rhodohalobacter sp. 614A TaxID=2908649 RepID=UPI001F20218D|nr:phosphatidylinositol-specific phospholipase C1-like protein [Rhodohalobacter sp. 614A]